MGTVKLAEHDLEHPRAWTGPGTSTKAEAVIRSRHRKHTLLEALHEDTSHAAMGRATAHLRGDVVRHTPRDGPSHARAHTREAVCVDASGAELSLFSQLASKHMYTNMGICRR